MNSPGSTCFVGLYQAGWIADPHSHRPSGHVLWLDALPGELVKVGHDASDLLPRTHLGVAFDEEPENRDRQQLSHELLGEK